MCYNATLSLHKCCCNDEIRFNRTYFTGTWCLLYLKTLRTLGHRIMESQNSLGGKRP